MDQAVVELTENIISILSNEASLLWGARDAIEDIKDELISMRSFLVDADRKGVGREGEKTWVANVRDMAYDVEDIIDNFMYHMNRQRIGGRSSWILHHTIYFPKNLWMRRQTATKIQKINGKIKGAIPERNQRYGIDRIEGTRSKDNQKRVVRHAESSLFLKEDELVGIEKKRQSIMDWLIDGEPHQTVISIVGMGGSGKTTLAANTYNNDDVKKHFDCCAWITISQVYELEDVLRRLIKEFHESRKEVNPADLNSMNYRLLVKTLVNYLEKKSYLLVLDDVWDTNLLDEIKVSLRDSCLGSRIILTTRKEDDVACHQMGGKHHIHNIELLLMEEAWELFFKKAFSSSPNGSCPPELKSFAQELVGKCNGLPLAIAALGSLMYSKNMSQWNEIYSSLNWKGFVEKVEGSTLEEVADSYLVKLTFRNMLQVVERNEFGRPRRFKMHDLLRGLALSISVKEKFGSVHDGGEEMKECKARRISIHKTDGELKSFTGMSKLRSFLVFNKALKTLPSGSKMLRVLDLEDAPIDELPDESIMVTNEEETLQMDALSSPPPNLRKLFLTGKLEKVPQWFCSLQSLTYLHLHWSRLEEDLLPHIAALPNLGRLVLTNAYVGKQLCFNTGFLKLTRLSIHNLPQLNEIIIEKGVMPNLKSLYIDSCKELKTVPFGIEYLRTLQELDLESVSMELENRINNEDFPKVQHIRKLYIWV
uniref:Uncharacterized protein n=1 Tax=Quercus lobata TaxID=97700 RepID=A0A7N2MFD5_QUELO